MSVRASHLSKRYGTFTAVQDLSFEVPTGSIFGFVGPNGAGKTTTLRILAALLSPTSGEAWISGESVIQRPRLVRQKVGYMPDFFGVYDDLTVTEYLHFYAHSHGVPRSRRQRVVADLLELIDLVEKRSAFVNTLSRGMKQRLGLARCLVHDPEVLLLDEPASGLDPRARIDMREILRELQKMGKTILVSSHILPELADLCTHLGIVNHGQVVIHGTVADVLARARVGQSVIVRTLDKSNVVAERLRTWPGVSRVAIESDGIVADLVADDEAMSALLRSLVEDGLPVVEFRKRSGGLEELFLAATGEQGGA
jgi:ABC-2 type transport system ATP-binding protein